MSASATKSAKKKPHLIPLGDRVVVQREESGQKTAGGILLPDSAKDKPARGVVVSVGEGKLTDKGTRQPLQVKPGDRVVFTSYAGEPFKVGDDELLLMRGNVRYAMQLLYGSIDSAIKRKTQVEIIGNIKRYMCD